MTTGLVRLRRRNHAALLGLGLCVGTGGLGCYSGTSVQGSGTDGETESAVSASGETGADASGGETEEPPESSEECLGELEPRELRRLSPAQSRNTLRDLFGDPELETTYDDTSLLISELGVRQLRAGAEEVLSRRDHWTVDVFGCDTSGAPDDTCAATFIDTFGARVFRRPLEEVDRAWLMDVYEAAAYGEQLSFADAMDTTLAAMLQAPSHIYMIERGTPVEDGPEGLRALTDHELAARLSYFLWDSMPDEELQRAADEGELATDAGLATQVERMLQSERAVGRLQHMVSNWLHLEGAGPRGPLEERIKDAELYPEFDPALLDAMRVEFEATVERALLGEGEASLERLFVDNEAYVNASLAELYGVEGPVDDDTWAWVQLPDDERAGVLTRAAFLTVMSAERVQAPILRGVYVLEDILCAELGEPPPNANDTPVEGEDDPVEGPMTVRETVEARTMTETTCAVCHGLINPAGYLFEHYDAIGRWRDTEVHSGLDIDATGELKLGDVAGSMNDAVELSHALAQSTDARACFAERWVAQAFDAELDELDECTKNEVVDTFVESGDVRELVAAIVRSAAFRHIRTAND